MKQEAESVWCRLARISRRTRSDRSPFRSNADDLFACSLQALRSHRDQSGTLRRSPMSVPKSRTIIKLQPTARAYRIIPLCTRGRSICLQQTETIASQAVGYYCFIPRPPAPCAPPAPYGPGSAPAALAPYLPLGRLQRGELTFLIAAPPWLLPSTSQQAGCSCRPGLIEVSWPPSLQRTAKCPTLHVHQQGCQCWGSKRVSQPVQ